MNKLKNFFRIAGKCLLWILYLMLTGKERQKYQHAKHARREVLDVKNDAFGSTYTLGRKLGLSKQPTRDYLRWSEFRIAHCF